MKWYNNWILISLALPLSATIIDFDQENPTPYVPKPPAQPSSSSPLPPPPPPAPRAPRPQYEISIRYPLRPLLRVFNPPGLPQLMPIREQLQCLKAYLQRQKHDLWQRRKLQQEVIQTQASLAATNKFDNNGNNPGSLMAPLSPSQALPPQALPSQPLSQTPQSATPVLGNRPGNTDLLY